MESSLYRISLYGEILDDIGPDFGMIFDDEEFQL
jgi:hypothetical protein